MAKARLDAIDPRPDTVREAANASRIRPKKRALRISAILGRPESSGASRRREDRAIAEPLSKLGRPCRSGPLLFDSPTEAQL